MKTVIISMLFLITTLSTYCQTQTGLNNKSKGTYEKSDKELNQVYQKIIQIYKSDTIFLKTMQEAQRQWVKFRDAQLKMKYPPYPNSNESVLSMCRYYYLEELTKDRIKDLKEWIDGVEEGDVCSGSIKLKGQ